MPLIHFLDGPCDSTTREVTQAVIDRGSISCQNTLYVYYKAGASGSDIVFVPADSPLGQAQTGAAGTPAHVTSAWSRWMRALGHKGPQAHNRVARAAARVRRIAR